MKLLMLVVLSVGSLHAQFSSLSAPGNGATLYYRRSTPAVDTFYRLGPGPATLVFRSFAQAEQPYVYGSPGSAAHFLGIHDPQFSRDGSVFYYWQLAICPYCQWPFIGPCSSHPCSSHPRIRPPLAE